MVRVGLAVLATARRLGRNAPRTACGVVRHVSWNSPGCDCYALLGVSPSSTTSEIKAAYLARAKRAHPDVGMAQAAKSGNAEGSNKSDVMVQLNLCYEALTQRRAEYDASRGVGGSGARAAAYSTSREPWWKNKSNDSYDDDFEDFGEEFEEAFHNYRRAAPRRRPSAGFPWREWAEAWRYEEENPEFASSRRQRSRRRRRRRGCRDDTDSDEDSSSEEEAWRRHSWCGNESNVEQDATRQNKGSRGHKTQEHRMGQGRHAGASRQGCDEADAPDELWLATHKRGSTTGPTNWKALVGKYQRLDELFNDRPAYTKVDPPALFLFWSDFGDWKLAERLEDDGMCVAFVEDKRGRRFPWVTRGPRWQLWDPASRRFVRHRLFVEASIGKEASSSQGEGMNETNDSEEVPWSRPPWSEWPTSDLIRWCEKRNINLHGCFDREAVLELVMESASEAYSSNGCHSGQSTEVPGSETFPGEDGSESDSQDPKRRQHRRSRNRSKSQSRVRVASRVKTDGSYTRPPVLDRRFSLYGNRVEHFRGEDADVLPWLQDYGDKSRLYSVYFDGDFCYSLVWKKQKFWGRPSYRSGSW